MSDQIRVLLVEDNVFDQLIFRHTLKRDDLHYDTVIVSSVQEARSALLDQNFDVVIADYHLGLDTAVKLLDELEDIPFILVTGLSDDKTAELAKKLGASDYLTKDIQGNYLKAIPILVEKAIKFNGAEIS